MYYPMSRARGDRFFEDEDTGNNEVGLEGMVVDWYFAIVFGLCGRLEFFVLLMEYDNCGRVSYIKPCTI